MAQYLVRLPNDVGSRWFEAESNDEARDQAVASLDEPDALEFIETAGLNLDDLKAGLTVHGPFSDEQAGELMFATIFGGDIESEIDRILAVDA